MIIDRLLLLSTTCPSPLLSFNNSCVSYCPLGSYTSNGLCSSCVQNCMSCNSTNCITCNPGFFLNSSSQCTFPCPYAFSNGYCLQESQISTQPNNLTYAVQYQNVSKNFYLPCSSNCLTCTGYQNCTSCVSSLQLKNSTCVCTNCSCTAPQLLLSDSKTCVNQTCPQKYFYAGNYTCMPCYQYCQSCIPYQFDITQSECLACSQGFYKLGNECVPICVQYDDNICSNTNSCQTNYGRFVYQLKPPACELCNPSCKYCVNASSLCTQCQIGFYPYNLTTQFSLACLPCTASNCANCSASVCYSCIKQYFLTGIVCSACPQACSQCQSSNICSVCVPFSQLTKLNTCACESGYILIKNQQTSFCDSCYFTCSACQQSTYSIYNCTACHLSNYLQGAMCYACSYGCNSCTSSSCLACGINFQNINNTCNCSLKISQQLANYSYLCTNCFPTCSKCVNYNCEGCSANQFLYQGDCYNCNNALCFTCDPSKPINCQSCYSGYTIYNNNCVQTWIYALTISLIIVACLLVIGVPIGYNYYRNRRRRMLLEKAIGVVQIPLVVT